MRQTENMLQLNLVKLFHFSFVPKGSKDVLGKSVIGKKGNKEQKVWMKKGGALGSLKMVL